MTATATSTPTAAVIDITPTLTTPVITGTAQEGQTLTASAAIANDADATVSYQWQNSTDKVHWTDVTNNQTGLTHLVTEDDEDGGVGTGFDGGSSPFVGYLRVEAISSDPDNASVTSFSAPTSAVLEVAPSLSLTTHSQTVGKTGTASLGVATAIGDRDDAGLLQIIITGLQGTGKIVDKGHLYSGSSITIPMSEFGGTLTLLNNMTNSAASR